MCYVGNCFIKYEQVDNAECNTVCEKNPNTICGGKSRNSVYAV